MNDDGRMIREMPSSECWERIESAPYGRIGTFAAGRMDIFPVNHGVDRGSIVFRTAPGTKLFALALQTEVLFEIDGVAGEEAFSVVVRGQAVEIEHDREIAAAEQVGVVTWAPGRRDHWVRIVARDVQGRAFEYPPQRE